MRIVDLLKKEAVVLNADVSEKEQMLDLLVDLHKKVGNIEDKEAFKAGIMKRESEVTYCNRRRYLYSTLKK